jgi:hypothetical protein
LGGSLLTVRGTRHTASLQGNARVDVIVARYLVDLATPPAGATCDPPPEDRFTPSDSILTSAETSL